MAHLSIEYSANLEPEVDIAALCDGLRRVMIETGIFPPAGVRVRAFAASHTSVADGDPKHGFIDMSLRLRGGRPTEAKKAATNHIFSAAQKMLQPVMDQRSLALSFEMRDIDPALSPKTGSTRAHLPDDFEGG